MIEPDPDPPAPADESNAPEPSHAPDRDSQQNATETEINIDPLLMPQSGEKSNESADDSQEDEMTEQYRVELDIFEGPLDLLLYLIKKDEVDVYDISIERITEQYMSYMDMFKMLNIGLAGEFLVMAANLCYIKSRMMLPKHVQPPEEDVDDEDPRWDLIRQLIEYKKFKEAANHLGERESAQLDHYRNTPEKIETDQEQERPLDDNLTIFDLIRAFENILQDVDSRNLGEVFDDEYTVGDKIEFIKNKLQNAESISFIGLFQKTSSKGEKIVTFLAMLELMKLNSIRVFQDKRLGEIRLERNFVE